MQFLSFLFVLLMLSPLCLFAEDSTCAEVKIEIMQELTLERQGFDAHMKINNGLSGITLENIVVEVTFDDEEGNPVLASSDPYNTGAVFFIRADSDNISDNQDGSWNIETVGPSSSSDLHWLIIPSPGASNGHTDGTLYFVGAKLTYTIGGEEHITEVTPDYIHVKPMPELQMDYFLTRDVFGDDAWTSEIEAPVPFVLGVRIKNSGYGTAKSLKIDSAQPKIFDNAQGLLVGFVIKSCEVNGNKAPNSLLADMGDIASSSFSTARWTMECSLSGRFTQFDAKVSHSDELGGELTSLITQASTHLLIKDVIVDVTGRDGINDFLAFEGTGYRVFESDAGDSDVTDQSASASLNFHHQANSEIYYTFTVPQTAGCVYAKVPDPNAGQKALKLARRADGKIIKTQNVWLSETRNEDHTWDHFINLFDVNTSGAYSLSFDDPETEPRAPVIQHINDKQGAEGQTLTFMVEATDPDGTVPVLSASFLPARAEFVDHHNETGTFSWTPAVGQSGVYTVSFKASDASLTATRMANITICSQADSDCDGMLDTWEQEHFGDFTQSGEDDFDGDGISDLQEYLMGSDPLNPDHAPTMPVINAPSPEARISGSHPELVVQNSTDADGDDITYEFQVFSDPLFTQLVEENLNIPETSGTSSWQVTEGLSENTWYYWRVRASDGVGRSLWNYGSFFLNTVNDPPGPMAVSAPDENANIDSMEPVLSVTNSLDPDQEPLSYQFTVFSDQEMTLPVAASGSLPAGADGTTFWKVVPPLNDHAWYYWEATARDPQGAQTEVASSFYIQTGNSAPSSPRLLWLGANAEINTQNIYLEAGLSTDPENDPLYYYLELDTLPTFDGTQKMTSGRITPTDDRVFWQAMGLYENAVYYWRCKSGDGAAESPWSFGTFFVNTQNDAPGCPTLKNPGNGTWVTTLKPPLSLIPGKDPDQDALTYHFEIYTDSTLTEAIQSFTSEEPIYILDSPLPDNRLYYWRAQSEDEHGEVSPWTPAGSFFVKDDGINDPPGLEIIVPSESSATKAQTLRIQWNDTDPDSNAQISLYYDTDNQGEDGVLIAQNLAEDPDGEADGFDWDISGLEGTYYIYAVIADEITSMTVYGSTPLLIDRTPATLSWDVAPGTYTSARSVTLSANEPADIYFTLDGSQPTQDSTKYSNPLEISETSVLSALSVDQAGNESTPVSLEYTIEKNISVTVITDADLAMAGLRVYAFTETGSYTGKSGTTDEQGLAVFNPADFSQGNYKFRIDYLGHQFWTDLLILPGQFGVTRIIEMESIQFTVVAEAADTADVRVYLFTETGSYLNVSSTADENGVVYFDLPAGVNYMFRADVLDNQYFSPVTLIDGENPNSISLDVGGGVFSLTIQENAQTPMQGIPVYLFNENGSYLNLNQTSASTGRIEFHVPSGTYKARADYLGYQFWTDPLVITQDTAVDLSIPHMDVTVSLNGNYQGLNTPLDNIRLYLFTPSGTYLNQSQITDEQGRVRFHLPDQSYKVRANILAFQYWSEAFRSLDTDLSIPMADARVLVTRDGQPVSNVSTYLFSTTGSYLNRIMTTGSEGTVNYRLPVQNYKFRADYLGDQHWSEETLLVSDQVNPVEINTGGGRFELTVSKVNNQPMEGTTCYLFNADGSYLNESSVTSNEGKVTFDLADGEYKIRIDHLGYQFWTPVYQVPAVLSSEFTIPHSNVEIAVNALYQNNADPMTGINVYLFTASGTYLNQSQVTDAAGKVSFDLPNQPYKVRADILGYQYWSEEILSGPISIGVSMADARITVAGAGTGLQGIPVYLFSASGSYLNLGKTTDSFGQTTFRLPANAYNFRADYQGSQYWSGTSVLVRDTENNLNINTGGGVFALTVLKNATEPLANTRCYLFNSTGTYLNLSAITSSEGVVTFNLSNGNYKIRIDHLGYQFWAPVFNVPATLSEAFVMGCQDLTVSVQGLLQTTTPLTGITAYLFTPTGSYLNQSRITDASGNVLFNLPDKLYKVRADYLGYQFWTGPFQSVNPTLTINQGQVNVRVHRSDVNVTGAKVYLFSESGSYLNQYKTTDSSGNVSFILPNRNYKFRADEGGAQIYSPVLSVQAGVTGGIEIDLAP